MHRGIYTYKSQKHLDGTFLLTTLQHPLDQSQIRERLLRRAPFVCESILDTFRKGVHLCFHTVVQAYFDNCLDLLPVFVFCDACDLVCFDGYAATIGDDLDGEIGLVFGAKGDFKGAVVAVA